jgi:ATP-binding cassette, subfamily B, bacterial PglK
MMENARANWKTLTLNTSPKYLLEVIAVISLVAVLMAYLFNQHNYPQGQIENLVPTLGLFAVAVIRLIPSFHQIVANLHQLNFSEVAIDPIYNIIIGLEEEQEQITQKGNTIFQSTNQLIVQDVNYNFTGVKLPVLKRVSFEISFGQSIALVGSSGAGKSTLANIIMGMLTPSNGKIKVDGDDINSNIQAWRKMIGYVPQSIYLLDASVRENVAFGLEVIEISDSKVWNVLKTTHLDDVIRKLPKGLDTVVGENGVRLSGGQRQRLGIARALYHQPEILVLDEATSALDNETEKEVSLAIDRLSGEKTLSF